MEPADKPQQWGEDFPFIAEWLDKFFFNSFQKRLWLSWLHHFYKNAYDGNPRKGQLMFIVGETEVGKTLMGHKLISTMMGGHTDAAGFLTGKEIANKNMFEVGLATVDDQEASADQKTHLRYSAIVKKITANQDISMREMYKGVVDLPWMGRAVITMNQDPESMQMLPNLDINNQDKVIILRTGTERFKFPMDTEERLLSELPYFCRYVYDWVIPDDCLGTARYVVRPYIDPSLKAEVDFSSPESVAIELIETWRDAYFAQDGVKHEEGWFGGITDLVREIEATYGGERRVLEGITPNHLSRKLRSIISKYDWIHTKTCRGKRGFFVENPHRKVDEFLAGV